MGSSEASAAALAEFLLLFDGACDAVSNGLSPPESVTYLLDGQASTEIRRLVPLHERRRMGAFFTPSELANDLAVPLRSAQGQVTVVDPCCGAGDLLLAAARALEGPVLSGTVTVRLIGADIIDEFSRVAGKRLELLTRIHGFNVDGRFITGDGLVTPAISSDATHVLLNPPFAPVSSRENCEWAQGKVNGAADFLAQVVMGLRPGIEVSAILPDVLRSGSRYRRWRNFVAEHLDLDIPEPKGRFDQWTDVDVFILRGQTRHRNTSLSKIEWVPRTRGPTVGERFTVSVGAVVDYRSPDEGPLVPFMAAKDFPTWDTISRVERSRRFSGRLHSGPMLVIPRTSRPGEPHRARAALVSDARGIAIENHLLVLSPRSGGVDECRRLMSRLQSEEVSEWLDSVIRCRHLTVKAVSAIPWKHSEGRLR